MRTAAKERLAASPAAYPRGERTLEEGRGHAHPMDNCGGQRMHDMIGSSLALAAAPVLGSTVDEAPVQGEVEPRLMRSVEDTGARVVQALASVID